MPDLTIHTGLQGESWHITVDWFDHNNVHHEETIKLCVGMQDKPRVLHIVVNDQLVKG